MTGKGRLVGMHTAFEQSRNRVILAVTALQGGLFCSGAVITYFLPQRSTAEWLIFLFLGLVSSVLYIKLINAQKYSDLAKHEYLGALVVWAGAIGFLQRVYFAYHGSLLDDPSIFAFRPVVSFFPLVAIGAIALTRTSSALKIIWALWAAMTVLSISGLFMHPDITSQRDGVIILFVWDFLAAPVFVFQLYAIPHYEDVLNQSKIELQAAHEKSALTEQLHQSEQRFSMALKGLQVGIWEYRRADGQSSMWWSERFYELVGYLPEEMAATADSFSGLFDDEDRKEFFQAATREQITTHSQIRLKTKNNGYRWFSIRAYWQRDADGPTSPRVE